VKYVAAQEVKYVAAQEVTLYVATQVTYYGTRSGKFNFGFRTRDVFRLTSYT
jgi:hypothetical protein